MSVVEQNAVVLPVVEQGGALKVKVDFGTLKLWAQQGRQGVPGRWGSTTTWPVESIREALVRVNRGAALLDEQQPGWAEKILPKELDMSSGEFCIIGQAYGDYDEMAGVPFGMEAMDGWSEHADELVENTQSHGFMEHTETTEDGRQPDPVMPFALLDRAWVYLLTARSQTQRSVFLTL